MHPTAPFVKRQGEVNAWDNPDFRKAVEATGRKQIIIAGITTDVSVHLSDTRDMRRLHESDGGFIEGLYRLPGSFAPRCRLLGVAQHRCERCVQYQNKICKI